MSTSRRRLFIEHLEGRRLLAFCPSGFNSLDETAQMIGSVQGATVITHGFQPEGQLNGIEFGDGDSLRPLAESIYNRVTGWLVDYDVVGGQGTLNEGGQGCFQIEGHSVTANTDELILLFDWAAESNEKSSGWAEAAGDALFSLLVGLNLVQPHAGTGVDLHFIGHSFGTVVTSETIERLARYGVDVDHVTYLDPHDFDQGIDLPGLPGKPFDTAQELSTVGLPQGYGASVWNNIAFADVYYQTTDENPQDIFGVPFFDWEARIPEGRPIPGGYNVWLQPDELIGGNPNTKGGDHSDVWNFYRETVLNVNNSTGYRFARLANPTQSPFRPNHLDPQGSFYPSSSPSPQDHEWSSELLVLGNQGEHRPGVPNDVGLQSLKLSEAEERIKDGRWAPEWNALSIINGDFEHPGEVGIFTGTSTIVPGWTHHGGGGDGNIKSNGAGGHFLELDFGSDSRTHNWLYIPPVLPYLPSLSLRFQYQRTDKSNDDNLLVHFDGADIGEIPLDEEDVRFQSACLPIPESLRGQTHSLTFEIIGNFLVESEVQIDNVRFGYGCNAQSNGVNVVEVIDRSGSMAGAKLAAAQSAANLFIDLMNQGDRVGVVSYSDAGRTEFPLTEITDSSIQDQAKVTVTALRANGGTSIGAGVRNADEELDRFPSDPSRAMIVMTDGQQNTAPEPISIINSQVDDDVCIFTIGFGSDADNQLLSQMANRPCGQFFNAPGPAELQQIYATLSGVVSGRQSISNLSGTIHPGQPQTTTLAVDPSINNITIGVNYAGSDLDLELTAPDGTVITHESAIADADIELVEGATFEFYRIANPLPGTWEVRIIPIDIPDEGEPFSLFTSVNSPVSAVSDTDTNLLGIGQPVTVQVNLNDGSPITGATVTATVNSPSGSSDEIPPLTLFDDGAHNDGAANDGVYGATFSGTTIGGTYTFDIEVAATANVGFPFTRTTSASVFVDVNIPVDNGELSGFVYVDANNNGIKEPQELGLPNVPVSISGPVIATAVTDAAGSYHFTNLPAGTYTLIQTQPAAFVSGINSHGITIIPEAEGDRFAAIGLVAGATMNEFNFGERGLRPDLVNLSLFFASTPTVSQLLQQLNIISGSWIPFRADATGTLSVSAEGESIQVYTTDMTPVAIGAGDVSAQLRSGHTYLLYVGEGEADVSLSFLPPRSRFTNAANPLDVNGDGSVGPLDALVLINGLNRQDTLATLHEAFRIFGDPNGDEFLSPSDVLLIVNHLNQPDGEGEGIPQYVPATPLVQDTPSFQRTRPRAVDASVAAPPFPGTVRTNALQHERLQPLQPDDTKWQQSIDELFSDELFSAIL